MLIKKLQAKIENGYETKTGKASLLTGFLVDFSFLL